MTQHPSSSPAFSNASVAPYLAQFAVVTASSFVLAGVLLGQFPLPFRSQATPAPLRCTQSVQFGQTLSREQLTTLRTLDGSQTKADLQAVLDKPHCEIAAIKSEAGTQLTGDVYHLEFDPQIWLVVLYSGDTYAGYRFEFR